MNCVFSYRVHGLLHVFVSRTWSANVYPEIRLKKRISAISVPPPLSDMFKETRGNKLRIYRLIITESTEHFACNKSVEVWHVCLLAAVCVLCLKVNLQEYIPSRAWKLLTVGYSQYSHIFGNKVFPCLQYNFLLRRNGAIAEVTIVAPIIGEQLHFQFM